MKRGEFELTMRQKALLREAYRRWTKFNHGKTIRTAWTGLGSATDYKSAVDAGLMEPVHELRSGSTIWWKLTEKGVLAMVMLGWIEGELYEEEIG